MKDMDFDVNKPKRGTKSKIPKKKMKQIEKYIDEIDDNTKQFASVLNELPTTSEDIKIILCFKILSLKMKLLQTIP